VPNLDRRFGLQYAGLPCARFALRATLLATTDIDLRCADRLFCDWPAQRVVGRDARWARDPLHCGGRGAQRAVAAPGLAMFAASFVVERRRTDAVPRPSWSPASSAPRCSSAP
jgi:hypothetical protein